jgi:beta-N-acetylhexosaminidase
VSESVERLAARTLLVGFDGQTPPPWVREAAGGLGGVVLYGDNLRSDGDAARIADELRQHGDALLAVDEEGGDVTRLHYTTGSPTPGNYVLGAADDVAATRAVAAAIGARLRASHVLLNLAPDADVNSNPANPVIGVRAFGAEPARVSRHTVAYVEGLQAQGVAACVKHFPGHGDTSADSHHELPVVGLGEEEWRRVHLPPFAAAIAAGTRTVMTAHIRFPALDTERPATLSRRILVGLLRDELGFDGAVITDALEMDAIAATYGAAQAAPLAIAAGADLLCLGARDGENTYRRALAAIVAAVESGALPLARLEEAAARVDALHDWTASAPSAGAEGDGGAGYSATRRAALVRDLAPLKTGPVLVELRGETNLAVGRARWDLAGPLAELGVAPVVTARVTSVSDPTLADALGGAGGHPVVVVGRDLPRHAWQREVLDHVRAAVPEAVLVDLGLPRPADLGSGPYVLVGGAARPNLRVAAELLAGRNGTQQD